jgi:hypothetical protein
MIGTSLSRVLRVKIIPSFSFRRVAPYGGTCGFGRRATDARSLPNEFRPMPVPDGQSVRRIGKLRGNPIFGAMAMSNWLKAFGVTPLFETTPTQLITPTLFPSTMGGTPSMPGRAAIARQRTAPRRTSVCDAYSIHCDQPPSRASAACGIALACVSIAVPL